MCFSFQKREMHTNYPSISSTLISLFQTLLTCASYKSFEMGKLELQVNMIKRKTVTHQNAPQTTSCYSKSAQVSQTTSLSNFYFDPYGTHTHTHTHTHCVQVCRETFKRVYSPNNFKFMLLKNVLMLCAWTLIFCSTLASCPLIFASYKSHKAF